MPRWALADQACRAYFVSMDRELADLWQQMLKIERAEAEPVEPANAKAIYESWERTFGEKVRQWRQARNWSQEDLAEQLRELGFDMHQTTVAKLEKGSRPLRVAEAAAISTIFGVPALAVFLEPPPEGTPMALEAMHEHLRLTEEHLESMRQSIYKVAMSYADAVMKAAELTHVLNVAALDAQRKSSHQEEEVNAGKGETDGSET